MCISVYIYIYIVSMYIHMLYIHMPYIYIHMTCIGAVGFRAQDFARAGRTFRHTHVTGL